MARGSPPRSAATTLWARSSTPRRARPWACACWPPSSPGAPERPMSTVSVDRLTALPRADLDNLCEAAEGAILAGGGFGWLKPPQRRILEAYWRGVLLIPERTVFVGRLDGVIAGSAQLVRPPRNNEAQAHCANL